MYNWRYKQWPKFRYNDTVLDYLVFEFAIDFGELRGMINAIPIDVRSATVLELMINEAVKAQQIKGGFYSRVDLISLIKSNETIHTSLAHLNDNNALSVIELLVEVHSTFIVPLSESLIKHWHYILFKNSNVMKAGFYRFGNKKIVIVSGSNGREIIHYEAPPFNQVVGQMKQFISWYNNFKVAPTSIKEILIKTSLCYLYFETINPFEDGNGRIGRILAEKCLAECLQFPLLLCLATVINKDKVTYYDNLRLAQSTLEVTQWIYYFSNLLLSAQKLTKQLVEFSLIKKRFLDTYCPLFNDRQLKVILKMLEYGPDGFEGGMTTKKYIFITKTSNATATRDLQYLLMKGIFIASGSGRSVSYSLCINI